MADVDNVVFVVAMILRIGCVTDEEGVIVMNEQYVSRAGICFVLR